MSGGKQRSKRRESNNNNNNNNKDNDNNNKGARAYIDKDIKQRKELGVSRQETATGYGIITDSIIPSLFFFFSSFLQASGWDLSRIDAGWFEKTGGR